MEADQVHEVQDDPTTGGLPAGLGKERLLQAIKALRDGLVTMVKDGQDAYESCTDINSFTRSKGSDEKHGLLLVYPLELYVECFRTAGVRTREELEKLWNQFQSDSYVKTGVTELLKAEEQWVAFIAELDCLMNEYEEQTSLPVAEVGSCIPPDLLLTETQSGDVIPLKTYLDKSKYTLFVLRKHYV